MERKTMLKIMIMVLILLLCGITHAFAESTGSVGEFDYEIHDDNSAVITRYHGKEKNLTLPSEIDGHPLSGIGDLAFSMNSSLNSVTIPDSVVSIGNNPWYNCGELTSIHVSPDNPALTVMDEMLIRLDDQQVISYPCGIKKNKITVPDGIKIIGDNAFSYCRNLKSIVLPDSVTRIGYAAFNGDKNLADILIPDSVTCIEGEAFGSCAALTRVTIPDSVVQIGNNPWRNCGTLVSIEVSPEHPVLEIIGGTLCSRNEKKLICFPGGRKDADYTMPDGIQSIGTCAFDNCMNLKQITVSGDVISIGEYAFGNCRNLKGVSLPESLQEIGNHAFDNCVVLAELSIPGNVSIIGNHSFSYCTGLTRIVIPDSMICIGDYAFNHCDNLTEIAIPDSVTNFGFDVFKNCGSLARIIVNPDSQAEQYCIEHELPYAYARAND